MNGKTVQPNTAISAAATTSVSAKPCKNLVLDRPHGAAALGQSLGLVAPAALERARQFARGKGVDRFPEPRAGRIVRRRHPGVMAAVVLDAEMGVAHRIVGEHAEGAVEPVRLVAEFVADQEGAAVDGADPEQQRDIGPPWQVLGADEGDERDEVEPRKHHRNPREPQVIRIVLHRGDHLGRRIVHVFADQRIQQRDQAEDEEERESASRPNCRF